MHVIHKSLDTITKKRKIMLILLKSRENFIIYAFLNLNELFLVLIYLITLAEQLPASLLNYRYPIMGVINTIGEYHFMTYC